MSDFAREDLRGLLREVARELLVEAAILGPLVACKPDMDTLKSITTYEEAMAQLRVFWGAERRPWFCRSCPGGYLQPSGKFDFCCKDCGTRYAMVAP